MNNVLRGAVLALVLGACRTGPPPSDGQGEGAAHPGERSESPGADAARLVGTPRPVVGPSDLACSASDDCRVYRPGAWNSRVECYYEYGCDLDFSVVNLDGWARIRAWQRANPFDCTALLRESGPCSAQPVACGLAQDVPSAECVEGTCVLALPEPWPTIDPAAQTCTSDAECVAHRLDATLPESRCCASVCRDEWVAVNRNTEREVQRWRELHATPCEHWRQTHECDPPIACDVRPPAVACRGGACEVMDLSHPPLLR